MSPQAAPPRIGHDSTAPVGPVRAALPESDPNGLLDETDVLIIGGGLVGCASAYYLAQEGVECLLVDRGEINREGSGTNAGSLHIQIRRPERLYRDDTLHQFIPLKVAAGQMWAGLERELGMDLGMKKHGGLLVTETQEDFEFAREVVTYEREYGLEAEMLGPSDLRSLAPHLSPKLTGASFDPLEGSANTLVVGPAYLRLAMAAGVRVRTHVAVTATEALVNGGFLVRTPRGTIRAKRILNAAGPWAGTLSAQVGVPLPIGGRVIQVNVTERREPLLQQMLGTMRPGLSLKQTVFGTFMIGGGWPATVNPATGLPCIDQDSVAGNVGVAMRVLPELADVQVVRTWLGVIAHSLDVNGDRLQVFGELPTVPGYFIVAGGTLFTMGPLMSRLIAEMMTTGKTSHPMDIHHPNRFPRPTSVPAPFTPRV